MKPVVLHEQAEAELRDALAWYDQRRSGLGGELRRDFADAVERIARNPQAYAVDGDSGIRLCPLRRFPYAIVFVERDTDVWVAAVAHQSRHPRYRESRRPS